MSRERDPIWDALAGVYGSPVTRSERGVMNRAVRELREAGCDPLEIERRATLARSRFPQSTPMVVAQRWTQLGAAPVPSRGLENVAAFVQRRAGEPFAAVQEAARHLELGDGR